MMYLNIKIKIKTLDLSINWISTLNNFVFTKLKILNLNSNQIINLPSLLECCCLEKLSVEENGLVNCGSLPSTLTHISFANNNITVLPMGIIIIYNRINKITKFKYIKFIK